jgi:sugar lactone lactonase YvrE
VRFFLAILVLAGLLAPSSSRAQVGFNGVQTTVGSGFNTPYNVALDKNGNVYVADFGNGVVKEILAAGGYTTVNTLGSGFSEPSGIAVDGSGNVFVSDPGKNAVYEILAAGGYTTVNPIGSGFNEPFGLGLDASGNLFVADTFNNVVKEIPAAGGYSTITTLPQAFSEPFGVALDENANLYVADTGTGQVTEVTEVVAQGGYTSVNVLASGFNDPSGVAVDLSGDVYLTDSANNAVKEILAVNGSIPASPTIVGLGSGFAHPYGLAVDGNADLYIADLFNNRVEELALASVNFGAQAVGTSGSPISLPFTIASGASTTVGGVSILTTGTAGKDFADAGSSTCVPGAYAAATTCVVNVSFSPSASGLRRGAVVVYGASGNVLASVPVYGTGTGPQVAFLPGAQSTVAGSFVSPSGVAADASGNLFAVDASKTAVYKIAAAGGYNTVSTLGSGLSQPGGVAVDGSGNIFVADSGNGVVKEFLAAGGYATVNTLASGFSQPSGLALDGSGNVFVSDSGKDAVLEISAASGYTVAITLATGFNNPGGLAVDSSGNLFVADSGNGVVKEILAGGYTVIKTVGSGFSQPTGVSVDASGSVYVSDATNNAVYEIVAAGGYSTVLKLAAGFKAPADIAVDGSGNVFVADRGNSAVKRLDFADAPSLTFASTPEGTTSSDSPQAVTIKNVGNAALTLAGLGVSAPFAQVAGPGTPEDCSASLSLPASAICNLSLSFTPQSIGAISGSATLTDNTLNLASATQTIALSGTGQQRTQTITFTGLPATATFGTAGPYTLNGTASSGLAVSYSVTGPATISGTTLTITGAGTVVVTASQAGNAIYKAATPVSQTVIVSSPYDKLITLQFGSTTLTYPAGTNLTVCVAAAHGVTATGSVQIFDGTSLLVTLPLQGGGCAYWYLTAGLNAGTHQISATYSGDKNNPAGNSASTAILVNPVPVTLADVCWSGTMYYGMSYTCVIAAGSNAGPAVGSITYSLDGGAPVQVPLFFGITAFAIPTPAVGKHTVAIRYPQQTNYAAASAPVQTFTVVKSQF